MATYKSIKYVIPIEAVEHTDSINSLSDVDTVTTAPTDYQILVWSAADSKWYPGNVSEITGTQKAIFGFGNTGSYTNITNLVSSVGVVSADTTGVGSARGGLAAAGFGGDKAIFGFGSDGASNSRVNETNLVSNAGVVASDTTGVGSDRRSLAAASYGGDKAIFGFGYTTGYINTTNLVSNLGVVASDTTGVGTARRALAAAGYGGDKAIFGFGSITDTYDPVVGGFVYDTNETNLVSNTGVVSSDVTGIGTSRDSLSAAGYGGDKAIFGFGYFGGTYYMENNVSTTNLVSNLGVVASDTTGVGTGRMGRAAAGYSTTA